jgi:hypothetical protein
MMNKALMFINLVLIAVITSFLFNFTSIGSTPTEILNTSANLATAIGIILLSYQIYLQREAQKRENQDRMTQILLQLTKDFDEDRDFNESIYFIHSRKAIDLIRAKLTHEERNRVKDVIGRYDRLGYRIRKGGIPKNEALEMFWEEVIRCAQQLLPYINDLRRLRRENVHGELPQHLKYMADFEQFAKECKLFHLRLVSSRGELRVEYKNTALDTFSTLSLEQLLTICPIYIYRLEETLSEAQG